MANESTNDGADRITTIFNNRVEGDYRPRSFFMDGDTVVMQGLPHPIEYVYGQVPVDIEKYVDLSEHIVCVSKEGTSILIFWHVDKWYVSTHKQLDSFKSYWADPNNTFGRSFAMGLAVAAGHELKHVVDPRAYVTDMCEKHLDKTKKYIFMLPAKYSERIGTIPVVEWPRPVQTIVMNDKFEVLENEQTFPGVFEPTVTLQRQNMDTLLEMVRRCDINSCQGLYFRRVGTMLQTKIYNRIYHERMRVRGNRADLKYAYMFCRQSRDDVELFTMLYPELEWRRVEQTICDTCSDIIELERGSRRVIPFDYTKFLRILRKSRHPELTYRNLLRLTETAPILFNQIMNARKKAIRTQEYVDQMEQAAIEDETDQDIFDQMDALEQFEYMIGTRQAE